MYRVFSCVTLLFSYNHDPLAYEYGDSTGIDITPSFMASCWTPKWNVDNGLVCYIEHNQVNKFMLNVTKVAQG